MTQIHCVMAEGTKGFPKPLSFMRPETHVQTHLVCHALLLLLLKYDLSCNTISTAQGSWSSRVFSTKLYCDAFLVMKASGFPTRL